MIGRREFQTATRLVLQMDNIALQGGPALDVLETLQIELGMGCHGFLPQEKDLLRFRYRRRTPRGSGRNRTRRRRLDWLVLTHSLSFSKRSSNRSINRLLLLLDCTPDQTGKQTQTGQRNTAECREMCCHVAARFCRLAPNPPMPAVPGL